jgi:hypothetical protein
MKGKKFSYFQNTKHSEEFPSIQFTGLCIQTEVGSKYHLSMQFQSCMYGCVNTATVRAIIITLLIFECPF